MSQARRAAAARKVRARRRLPIWIGLGVVIVAAAVIAVVASGGSSHSRTASGIVQVRPVTAAGSLPPASSGGPADPAVGAALPTIRGQSFDGTPMVIGPDGRPKVIVVVAHWCPHCQREMPLLTEYLRVNPAPAGVDLVVVATDTASSRPNYPPSTWLAAMGWPTPVLADDTQGDAGQALGATGFPSFVAVNAKGMVVSRSSGEIPTSAFGALLASVVAP